MINKYHGETILWEVNASDADGAKLVGESPVLRVKDALGTEVLTGTGAHNADGTYQLQGSVTNTWGTGPISYYWNITGANGSAIEAVTNEINIISGTTEPPAYVYESELCSYYSRIGDYLDDNSQDKIISSYHYINRLLETMNISVPRKKKSNGLHDQSVRDMNAWFSIYHIVANYQVNQVSEGDEPWYNKFWGEGTKIYEDIKKKKIVFTDQVSPADAGISEPTRTAGSSIGTMFNNWDRSYGQGFSGADFNRDWSVEVIDTGTAGGLFETKAKWSKDGGITFGTITTDYGWIAMGNEVYVRFDKGTSSGTTGIFAVGDKWEFRTEPIKKSVGGQRNARSY